MTNYQRLERAYAQSEGWRVAYALVGSGPPVLLLHGLGGTADFWQPAIERLAGSFTLLVPDLLGFGFSDKPHIAYSLAQHTGAMLAVLRATGHSQLHGLVGHSAGGVVTVALLASGLVRTDRLVLASSAYPSPRFPVRQELVHGSWFNRLLDNRRLARLDDAIWRGLWPLFKLIGRSRVPAYLQGGLAGFMDYSADSYYGTVDELLLCATLDPLLPHLHGIPALIMHARNDGTVPVIHAERLAAALPGSQLELLASGGHYAVIREGLPALEAWLINA